MPRTLAPLIAALALTITGCSSTPATDSTPEASPTADANLTACGDFEEITGLLATRVVAVWDDSATLAQEQWLKDAPGEIDMIALTATGDVKTRMADVVKTLTTETVMVMSLDPETYFEQLDAVGRACVAAGYGDFKAAKWN